MAVRPPGSGSDPDHIEFGIAALGARVEEAGVEFPATTEEICAGLDETRIPYDGSGNTLDLREELPELETDKFESEREFLETLHPVFERKRVAGRGLIEQLRGFLPF